MIKPEQIKFLRDHPVHKSLFSKNVEDDKALSLLHIVVVPHVFLFQGREQMAGGHENVVTLPVRWDGCILEESTPYSDRLISLVNTPESFKIISDEISKADENSQKKGKYLALNGLWCSQFWHWMMEYIIKAIIAMDAGFDGYYIIPDIPFARESLELLGIETDKIISYDGKTWLLETLYIPQPITGGQELKKFPVLIQKMRDKFLQAAVSNNNTFERIYIARPQNAVRKVVNEPELMEILGKYQFQRIIMEQLPLKEQIRIVSAAKCIIGPHGAGMVHCLFMPPESLVVELFSPTYINPCMLPVIEHLKHRYYMIPSANNRDYIYGDDIEANIPVIEVTLKRELKT